MIFHAERFGILNKKIIIVEDQVSKAKNHSAELFVGKVESECWQCCSLEENMLDKGFGFAMCLSERVRTANPIIERDYDEYFDLGLQLWSQDQFRPLSSK
jgi:hypothetical protein